MEIVFGNHLKIHAHKSLKQKIKDFYTTMLGCKSIPTPMTSIECYKFEDGFVVGVYFGETEEVLSEKDQHKGAWLEIKTDNPDQLKKHLIDFGVKEVNYEDKSRFYFQAPGGQVFRIALLEDN